MASPAFKFDGENITAQRVARSQAARMVTRISMETQQALRAIIARSIREGIPPYDAARLIRSLIGMTAPQAHAAMNYRQGLVDQGLTLERVNTLVDRYVEKKIRERAESIARTEIMEALNAGAEEGWRQARAGGLLSDRATKEVIVTPDERLCPVCAPLDGQRQPIGKPFHTAEGPKMHPPFHVRCRCTEGVNP